MLIPDVIESPSPHKYHIELMHLEPVHPLKGVDARAAIIGDILSRIFNATNDRAVTTFRVNDTDSNSLNDLVTTVYAYYISAVYSSDLNYEDILCKQEYARQIAHRLTEDYAGELVRLSKIDCCKTIEDYIVAYMVEWQKDDLEHLNVVTANWFYSSYIIKSTAVLQDIFKRLSESDKLIVTDDSKIVILSDGEVTLQSGKKYHSLLIDVAYLIMNPEGIHIKIVHNGNKQHFKNFKDLCEILGYAPPKAIFVGDVIASDNRDAYTSFVVPRGYDNTRLALSSVPPSDQLDMDVTPDHCTHIKGVYARLNSLIKVLDIEESSEDFEYIQNTTDDFHKIVLECKDQLSISSLHNYTLLICASTERWLESHPTKSNALIQKLHSVFTLCLILLGVHDLNEATARITLNEDQNV